jgi:hypothetical protein
MTRSPRSTRHELQDLEDHGELDPMLRAAITTFAERLSRPMPPLNPNPKAPRHEMPPSGVV